MTEEFQNPLVNIEVFEEVEETFVDDDDDSSDVKNEKLYAQFCFPEEEPTSIRFKGKKRSFIKSVESLKVLLKKGDGKSLSNVSFRVLDSRKMPHGVEYDIETLKEKDRGVSILKIYGPTPKKGCTVMITKSKEHDAKFVGILATDIIKQLFDKYTSTDGWKNIFEISKIKKPTCQVCNKTFCSEKNLKTHFQKYHQADVIFQCDKCDYTVGNERGLKEHHQDSHVAAFECGKCDFEAATEQVLKDHISEKHETVVKCCKCPFIAENEQHLNEHMTEKHCAILKCEECDFSTELQESLKEHHQQKHETENMDIDNAASVQNDGQKSEEALKAKVIELENRLQNIIREHEQVVDDLTTKFENKKKECESMKAKMEKLVKEDGKQKTEIKKLKEENQKIAMEIGHLQFNNDKVEAEVKSREKLSKMKENTKLLNRIIEKQLDDGIIKNVCSGLYGGSFQE